MGRPKCHPHGPCENVTFFDGNTCFVTVGVQVALDLGLVLTTFEQQAQDDQCGDNRNTKTN